VRICSGAGCLRAVPEDARYCEDCKPAPIQVDDTREHSNAYTAELDAYRKSLRWQSIRARVICEQPLCARCERHISEIVDHVVPAQIAVQQARDSGRFSLDRSAGYFFRSNLQGLCRPCHWVKTLEDKTHVGPWLDVVTTELNKAKRSHSFF